MKKSETHPERDQDIRTAEGKTDLNSSQATRLMRKSVLVVKLVAVLGSTLSSAVCNARSAAPVREFAWQTVGVPVSRLYCVDSLART